MSDYKHEIIEFYGDPIRFFINEKKALIGCRSIADGIGLSWSTQLRRLKSKYSVFINTVRVKSIDYVAIDRPAVCSFVYTLDVNRIKNSDRLELYRRKFPEFVYDSVNCSKTIEIEDRYLEDKNGIRNLINDSVISLGNPNAVDQLSTVIDRVINSEIFPEKIPFFEKENCPKTRKAFADLLMKMRLEYSKIPDEIFDLAEKTADRQGELERHKSKSLAAQVLDVAEQIYNTDRVASRTLTRISKSLR